MGIDNARGKAGLNRLLEPRKMLEPLATGAWLLTGHPDAKALEIPQELSWYAGIADHIRPSVRNEAKENFTVYLRFRDGTGEWMPVTKGGPMGLKYDRGWYKDRALTKDGDTKPEVMCFAHAHPEIVNRPVGEDVHSPPSDKDIADARIVSSSVASVGMEGISVEFDARGAWYYAASPDAKTAPRAVVGGLVLSDQQHQKWLDAYSNFVRASAKPDFDFAKEFPTLRAAYQTELGGDVRFVPYLEIQNEPPCAGVDYVPQPRVSRAEATLGR